MPPRKISFIEVWMQCFGVTWTNQIAGFTCYLFICKFKSEFFCRTNFRCNTALFNKKVKKRPVIAHCHDCDVKFIVRPSLFIKSIKKQQQTNNFSECMPFKVYYSLYIIHSNVFTLVRDRTTVRLPDCQILCYGSWVVIQDISLIQYETIELSQYDLHIEEIAKLRVGLREHDRLVS